MQGRQEVQGLGHEGTHQQDNTELDLKEQTMNINDRDIQMHNKENLKRSQN